MEKSVISPEEAVELDELKRIYLDATNRAMCATATQRSEIAKKAAAARWK